MSAFTNVNIKDLTQIEEVVSGNLLIVETENGTNTVNFDNFVVGPDNVSWYTAFETVSGQVATLSADLSNVNYTERSALTSLSARVLVDETYIATISSDLKTLSSNFLALSGAARNPTMIVWATGIAATTFPSTWNTAKITVIGGGGGGGGAFNTAGAAAAGGGSGAISVGYVSGIANKSYIYGVGIGGAAGAINGTGANGGNSFVTITSLNYGITAWGGSGGANAPSTSDVTPGGAGGVTTGAGNANYTFGGTIGGPGRGAAAVNLSFGGDGGTGYLGQGIGRGNTGQTAGGGSSGTSGTGAGGGGGRQNSTGGQGGSGIVIIELIA
jgi:hypothetical protein